jgi:hypothetical protein
MTSVVDDSAGPDRGDAVSVTAQIPVIDDYAAGPQDPNPPDETPPPEPDPEPEPAEPVRINHLHEASVAAVVTIGLAVVSKLGVTPLLIGVAVVQGLLVLSWVFGTALPGRIGGLVTGALAAGGSDFVVSRWPHGQLGTLLAVLGLAIPVMFLHQLTRGVVRTRVVESLSDIALMVVAVVGCASLMQLRHETLGALMTSGFVLAAGAALVTGHVVDLVLPKFLFDPDVPRGFLAVIAGAMGGAVACFLRLHNSFEFDHKRSLFVGGGLGALISLFAIGAAFVEHSLPAGRRPLAIARPVASTLLPFGLLVPIGYLLCLSIRR